MSDSSPYLRRPLRSLAEVERAQIVAGDRVLHVGSPVIYRVVEVYRDAAMAKLAPDAHGEMAGPHTHTVVVFLGRLKKLPATENSQ